jgi:hypothetical protein
MKVKASGLIAAALLTTTLAAAPLLANAAEALPAAFEGTSTLQASGVVKSINRAQQSLTVLDAQGHEASFNITRAGDLAQISQGGKVQLRMVRNAIVRVTQAAHSQSPVAAQPDTIERVNAEVQAVDHASGVMALKRANGAVFHIQGREPSQVSGVAPGMQVSVVFAPQVSVAVAPAL